MSVRERLIIEVRADGTEVTTREILRIGRAAEGTVDSIYLLRRAIRTVGLGFATTEVVRLVDAYINMTNRLAIVTSSTAELRNVMSELYDISQETRSSFQENAELFNRMALATRGFGLSQRELLDITRTLNQTVITAGVGVREANNALIQFSQGVAAGRLNGDELRSVLEQLPPLADILAKELGVTRGELRKLGREGAITTDVIISALQNAEGDVAALFARTIPTIGQAFTVLRNAVLKLVGEFDQANGISHKIAASMIWLAENLETVVKAALALAFAFGVNALFSAMTSLLKMTGLLRVAMDAGGLAGSMIVLTGRVVGLTAALGASGLASAMGILLRASGSLLGMMLFSLPMTILMLIQRASILTIVLATSLPGAIFKTIGALGLLSVMMARTAVMSTVSLLGAIGSLTMALSRGLLVAVVSIYGPLRVLSGLLISSLAAPLLAISQAAGVAAAVFGGSLARAISNIMTLVGVAGGMISTVLGTVLASVARGAVVASVVFSTTLYAALARPVAAAGLLASTLAGALTKSFMTVLRAAALVSTMYLSTLPRGMLSTIRASGLLVAAFAVALPRAIAASLTSLALLTVALARTLQSALSGAATAATSATAVFARAVVAALATATTSAMTMATVLYRNLVPSLALAASSALGMARVFMATLLASLAGAARGALATSVAFATHLSSSLVSAGRAAVATSAMFATRLVAGLAATARQAITTAAAFTAQLIPALYGVIRAGTIATALFLVRLPAALLATSRAAGIAAVMLLTRIPMGLLSATRAGAGFIATFARGIPAALAGLGRGLLSIGATLSRLAASFGDALRVALSFGKALAVGGFTVLLGGLAAGSAALWFFRDNIQLVEGELTTLGDFFRAAGEVIGPYFTSLKDSVVSTFQSLSSSISSFLGTTGMSVRDIIVSIAQGVDQVIFFFRGMVAAIPVFFQMLPAALKDLGIQAINAVIFAFRDGMTYLWSAIQSGVDYIVGIFRAMPTQIASETSSLVTYLSTAFINDAITLAQNLPGMIWDVFKSIGVGIVNIFNTALDLINAGWNLLPNWFKDIMIQAMNGMITYVEMGVNKIIGFFYNLPETLVTLMRDGIKAVGELFWQLVDYLRGLPAAFGAIFMAAMEAAKNKVKEGLNTIIGWFNNIPGLEIPTFEMVADGSEQAINALGSLGGKLDEVADSFARANAEGRNFITLPRITNPYEGAARDAMTGLADFFQSGLDNRNAGAAKLLGEAVGKAFNSGFEEAGPTEGLVNDLLSRADKIAIDRRSDRLLIEKARKEQEAALATPPATGGIPGSGDAAGAGGGGRSQKELDTLQSINRELQNEYDNLMMTAQARAVNERMLKIEEQLRENNISLTQQEAVLLAQKVVALEKLKMISETVSSAVDTVFSSVSNSIGELIKTGEFNFREFITNIVAELATLATTKFFLEPLADNITSFITNALGQLSANTGSLFGAGATAGGDAAAATALTTAATTLTTSGATLSSSGAALSASGATISAGGATLSASGATITAAGGTLTASGGSLTAASGTLTASATTASTALVTSATALTTSASALSTAASSMGLGSLFGGLPGHYNGADFTVGGRGGVDNNLVAFRATRGERVQVTPAGQSSDRPVQVVMHISTPDVAGFKRSESQLAARAARMIGRGGRNT